MEQMMQKMMEQAMKQAMEQAMKQAMEKMMGQMMPQMMFQMMGQMMGGNFHIDNAPEKPKEEEKKPERIHYTADDEVSDIPVILDYHSPDFDWKPYRPLRDEDGYYIWSSWRNRRNKFMKNVYGDISAPHELYDKLQKPFVERFPYIKKEDRK